MATSVMGVMKMGNIAPRAAIEPTSLTFWASELTVTPPRLADVTILPKLTCLCSALPGMSMHTTQASALVWKIVLLSLDYAAI